MNYPICNPNIDSKNEDLPVCQFCIPFPQCVSDKEVISQLRYGRSPSYDWLAPSYPYQVLTFLLPRCNNLNPVLKFYNNVSWCFPELSRQRLLILVRVLEVIAITRLTDFRTLAHLRCIRKRCKVVSEPFITTEEIRTFLCDAIECDESKELVQEICSEFRSYVQPIPLKQLCRSVIHHDLKKTNTLSVSKLVILPKSLQKFILQKCSEGTIFCKICVMQHTNNRT